MWTGNELVVWGGWTEGGSLTRTGARYDPDSDVWFPMQMNGAPVGRYLQTTVWTGQEMIVWGGRQILPFNDPPTLNTGGRYDPGSNIWSRFRRPALRRRAASTPRSGPEAG